FRDLVQNRGVWTRKRHQHGGVLHLQIGGIGRIAHAVLAADPLSIERMEPRRDRAPRQMCDMWSVWLLAPRLRSAFRARLGALEHWPSRLGPPFGVAGTWPWKR